jgi:hypothetical protein
MKKTAIKLMAIGVFLAGGLAISLASAQPLGGSGDGLQPPGPGTGAIPSRPDTATTGTSSTAFRGQWEYRFVDLKNDDREAFEKSVKQQGVEGWELCATEHLRKGNDAAQLVLVFKRLAGGGGPLWPSSSNPGGLGFPPGGNSFPGGTTTGGNPFPGGGGKGGTSSSGGKSPGSSSSGSTTGGGGPGVSSTFGSAGMGGSSGASPAATPGERMIQVVVLKHANAAETAQVLTRVFNREVGVTPDDRTNSVILRAEKESLREAVLLIERLDIPVPPRK